MPKLAGLNTLPPEIRTALEHIDEPEFFSVERNRFEAITVVNKRLSRVFKFIRRYKKLLLLLDKEVKNLALLRKKQIPAPTVLSRQRLKQYDMVSYAYVNGDIVEGSILLKHAMILADAHRTLHLAFMKTGTRKVAEWNSARMLKPILSKANSAEYAPELVAYARSIARALKDHELAHEEVTFIHSDSHLSNVVFQLKRAVLIDWAEAGWASRFFELGVTIHAMLYEKKAIRRELIVTYLNEYFGAKRITERDVRLIELHVKLRFLEGATWHLSESKEDQLLYKVQNAKFVADSWRKAERFDLAKLFGVPLAKGRLKKRRTPA
jgi:Ser/Thr protein kinase RdoA (MazF antagonist)